MKRCPYCAEEIQDAAIKCRWCGSDLTVAPGKVVANPPPGLLESGPTRAAAPAGEGSGEDLPAREVVTSARAQPAASDARTPEILSPPRTPSPNANLTFSHESPRYLLGYTAQYYGVWDKNAPGPPVKRFPRTDQGWQQAWEAFIRSEMGAE